MKSAQIISQIEVWNSIVLDVIIVEWLIVTMPALQSHQPINKAYIIAKWLIVTIPALQSHQPVNKAHIIVKWLIVTIPALQSHQPVIKKISLLSGL